MTSPNAEHMKEMHRVISWILRTKNVGLRLKPTWQKTNNGRIIYVLRGICDSMWGSDPDDSRSVSGYILYFMGAPIA